MNKKSFIKETKEKLKQKPEKSSFSHKEFICINIIRLLDLVIFDCISGSNNLNPQSSVPNYFYFITFSFC